MDLKATGSYTGFAQLCGGNASGPYNYGVPLGAHPMPSFVLAVVLDDAISLAFAWGIRNVRLAISQEVRRREAAEIEVSEAQGCLNNSREELGELRHLAWKLEQMGRSR